MDFSRNHRSISRKSSLVYGVTDGAACEIEPGAFMTAFDANRADATALIAENDAVAQAVCKLVVERPPWTGTATELLDVLVQYSSDTARRARDWPQTPRALAGRLRRLATVLRKSDVRVEFDQRSSDKARSRYLIIERVTPPTDKGRDFASGLSEPSEVARNQEVGAGRSEAPMASSLSDFDRTHRELPDGSLAPPSDSQTLIQQDFGWLDGSDAKSPAIEADPHSNCIEVRI